MNMKLYMVYVASLVMLACSGADVSGSSDDPSVLTAEKSSSSSSVDSELSSSSKDHLVLCKVSGDWGDVGCLHGQMFGDGDLLSIGDPVVKTNVYASDFDKFGEHAGEIFFETDSIEGSVTRVFLHPDSSSKYNGFLSGDYQFDPDSMTENSYFNIGFYVAGFDSDGTALSADVSNWKGICMMYRGSIDPVIQLDLGDSLNQIMGYALPSVTVITQKEEKSNLFPFESRPRRTNEVLCYDWNQFKQPDIEGAHEIISGEEAAKHVEKVIFHFQAQPGSDNGSFRFLAIGTGRDQENQSAPPEVDPCKGKGGKTCVIPGHGDLWSVGDYQVNTKAHSYRPSKFGNNAGTFFFEDNSEKGAEIEYELHSTYETVYGNISNIPDYYPIDSLSFAVVFGKGYVDNSLFSDVGFYVAGFDTNGEMLSANIQNWNGICVVANYEHAGGDVSLSMQLDLGDSINSKIGGALPEVALESSESTQCFEWNQFKQPDTDKKHETISGEEAAKHVAKVKFHIQTYSGNSIVLLNILAIGSNRNE